MPKELLGLTTLGLCLCPCLAAAQEADQSIVLAGDGSARAVIVTDPELRNWRERLAVRDLAEYLHRVTGAVFPIVKAGRESTDDHCIYVHRVAAEKLGIDPATLDGEEWMVTTSGGDLCLTGGARDGFLYAVYHFLEDVVGVRWWSADEEFIPHKPALAVGPLDLRGKPAFPVRFSSIAYGRAPAHAGRESMYLLRNRCEYWYHPRPDGEYEWNYHFRSVAMPWCHALLSHVPPAQFADHPEWFAEIDGNRTTDARDLCLSNEGARSYAAEAVKANIRGARAHNAEAGWPEPFIFSLGREDNAEWCQCPRCTAYSDRLSNSDLMLDFVNSVAAEVAREYPDALVAFLAYQATAPPPKSAKPLPNVMPIYCTEGANEACPLSDPSNSDTLAHIKQWAQVSEHLMVYAYRRTFQRFQGSYGASAGHDFPSPNVLTFAADLRLLRSLGVDAIHNEHEDYLTQDFRDLKSWMLTRLMEDPDQDEGQLMDAFLEGYYGAAAPAIRRYLAALEAASRRRPSRIWFFADLLQFQYLDLAFLTEANQILGEAEDLAPEWPTWRENMRVRHARLSVDRAILLNWPRLVREWVLQGHDPDSFPIDRAEVSKRHEKCIVAQIHLRAGYAGIGADRGLQELRADQARFAGRLYWDLPLPERFAGVERSRIFDFPAQSAVFTLGPSCRLMSDPEAAGGEAVVVTGPAAKLPLTWQYQPTWGAPRDVGAGLSAKEVRGPGYQWHSLGEHGLDTSNSGLVLLEGDSAISFWGSAVDPGTYEVWASLAFRGPGRQSGEGDAEPSLRLERIIAVRAGKL